MGTGGYKIIDQGGMYSVSFAGGYRFIVKF